MKERSSTLFQPCPSDFKLLPANNKNYQELLSQLVSFLTFDEIQPIYGVVCWVNNSLQEIQFPAKEKIDAIIKTHSDDPKVAFESLLDQTALAMNFFLTEELELNRENLSYLPRLQFLINSPLAKELNPNSRALLEKIILLLRSHFKQLLWKDKSRRLIAGLLEKNIPFANDALEDYLFSYVSKDYPLAPETVKKLLVNRKPVNGNKKTPLMILFSKEYDPKEHKNVLEICKQILPFEESEANYYGNTAYVFAVEHNYPKEFTGLLNKKNRCVLL